MVKRAVVAGILLAACGAGVAAQVSPFTPPPDLAAPPADAVKSASGLISKTITPGSGTHKPSGNDVVTVQYTAWAASDGRMFDSSITRGTPATFPLDKALPGWRECVQLMTVGEKRRCWIPEKLAYNGQAGRPTGAVVFDVELIDTGTNPTIPPPDVKAPPADVKKTATGLAYRVLQPGKGTRSPAAWSTITANYTGWTTDGKMIDSSVLRGKPMTVDMSTTQMIAGWVEGVALMVEGERTRFWIPEELAYKGEAGQPKGMLVFDIELIRIDK
jgi:peptidylprolyl isomerase